MKCNFNEFKIVKLFKIKYKLNFPCFEITYSKCGYFDGRPQFVLGLIFFQIIFYLPWINEEWQDESNPPMYGIAIRDKSVWIYRGGKGNLNGGNKWWCFDIPFITWRFYKHYILSKKDDWIDVTYQQWDSPERKKFEAEIGYLGWVNELPDDMTLAKVYYGKWIDHYDDSIIDAKYRVEKRQWRPKWLTWTSLFQKEYKYIEVCFKDEVGSKKGTWKGGVISASCDFKPCDNDDPVLCFNRMNNEKKW